MLVFHDVEQNTEEWGKLRAPRITGSALSVAMANYGKAFGEPAKKYAINIALGQITGNPIGEGCSNQHMDRGHEEEPVARSLYEKEYFCTVDNGGFFEDGDIGCSPDGLISKNGLIEIKSAIPSIHFKRLKSGSYDSAYKWQLIGNMKIAGREWIDFISYCSQFPEGKKLYVYRCYAKDFKSEYEMIDNRLDEFRELIAESKKKILYGKYTIN